MMADKELRADDPLLTAGNAPFEGSAILRMHRGGIKSQEIMRQFKLRGTQLIKQIETGTFEMHGAANAGRPVHEAYITEDEE